MVCCKLSILSILLLSSFLILFHPLSYSLLQHKQSYSAKMYYFPRKENPLVRVPIFKSAWDRMSGIHCLLLLIFVWKYISKRVPTHQRRTKFLLTKFLEIYDSDCHHEILRYWKVKEQIKFCKKNTTTFWKVPNWQCLYVFNVTWSMINKISEVYVR